MDFPAGIRNVAQPSTLIDPIIHAIEATIPKETMIGSIWTSGEGDLVKAVRRLATREWGLPPEAVTWVPFWFHGRARP